jgi:hypothetical protein
MSRLSSALQMVSLTALRQRIHNVKIRHPQQLGGTLTLEAMNSRFQPSRVTAISINGSSVSGAPPRARWDNT